MPKPATGLPHLARYINHMRTLPSLRQAHARENLTDWIGDEN
jgi:glutathione S-transferase